MMMALGGFFQFLKILIFWVVMEVKGQKMVQNDKKSVCHAPYLKNHTLFIVIYGAHL